MIRAARLEQFGAPPKQRFCCLRGKATRAGETDVSLQGNAASSPGREGDSQNRAVSAGYCMLAFQHWKRDAAPLGSKASVCSFACRAKAVMAHCPWLCAFEKCAGAVRYLHFFVRTREAFNPAKASKVIGPSGCMVECRALPAGEQPLLWGAASAFLFRLWRRCRFRRAGAFFGKQLAVA